MIAKPTSPGALPGGTTKMRPDGALLVIGPRALREAVWRNLPETRIASADHALAGLWQAGQQSFDGIVFGLAAGRNPARAVRCLRELAPHARIVVAASAREEPQARAVLDCGADEYVLEPLLREDLEAALQIQAVRPPPPAAAAANAAAGPSPQEIVVFSDILRFLADGPRATLERFAALVAQAFRAAGVFIEYDDLAVGFGDHHEPVLEQPIVRQDAPVGRICLARCVQGSYAASAAARLLDYARLIDATVSQSREREHWRALAWTDDLSNLRNRRFFERALDELLRQATAERLRVTVLLFDIDDFKGYNDRFGHGTGDALIREVGILLKRCSREADIVARYGGDEFVVVFWDAEKPRVPGSQHPSEPMAVAERFCAAIRGHNFQCLGPSAPGPITISGGLACFPWDGQTRAELLQAADAALLNAKRLGKNCIELAGGRPEADAEPDSASETTAPDDLERRESAPGDA